MFHKFLTIKINIKKMNLNKFQIIGLFLLVSIIIFFINIIIIKIMLIHFIIGKQNLLENIKSGKINKNNYSYLSIKYFIMPLIILIICIIIFEVYLDKRIIKPKKIKNENLIIYNEYQKIKDNDEDKMFEIYFFILLIYIN